MELKYLKRLEVLLKLKKSCELTVSGLIFEEACYIFFVFLLILNEELKCKIWIFFSSFIFRGKKIEHFNAEEIRNKRYSKPTKL